MIIRYFEKFSENKGNYCKKCFYNRCNKNSYWQYGGSLKDARPDDLAAGVIKEIVKRNFDKKT
jgi:hypothetical protein